MTKGLLFGMAIGVLICLAFVATSNADTRSCYVLNVVDGDTVDLMCSEVKTRVRLIGVDSFESYKNNRAYRQAYENQISLEEVVKRGKAASEVTRQLLGKRFKMSQGANVRLEYNNTYNKDRYGRLLGTIYLNNVNVSQQLIKTHPMLFLKYNN